MALFFLHLTVSLPFSLHSLLSISLRLLPFRLCIFFLPSPHHLHLFPSFVNSPLSLCHASFPPSLFSPSVLFFFFLSLPLTCSVSGEKMVGGSSLWQSFPNRRLALASRQLSAVPRDRGEGGHGVLCGDMFLMLLCHSQHPQRRPPTHHILLEPGCLAPVTASC